MFLASQMYPEVRIGLHNAYLNATQDPNGYLLLHPTQDRNDGLGFRTNIFPNDIPALAVYPDIGDEAREI